MNKVAHLATLAAYIILVSGLTGCANMKESEAGATTGAVVGGAVALLSCMARGNSPKECQKETITGIAVGGTLGGLYGQKIQKRREKYESDADYYAGENVQLAARNSSLRARNKTLDRSIADAQAEENKLRAELSTAGEKRAEFDRYIKIAEQSAETVERAKNEAAAELGLQESVLAKAKASGSGASAADIAKLETEIGDLRRQIETLEKSATEFARISSTTF